VRRALVVLVVAALASCDGVLGLHTTRAADAQQMDAPDAFVVPNDDEDGDGFSNEIDNCPGIFNQSQADRDRDGVGDACDPHPDTPGDFIVATEYFNVPTYSWTPDSGTNWALDEMGALVTTATGGVDATNTALSWSMSATSPTIEVGFAVVDYGTTMPGNHVLTIASDFVGTPSDPSFCDVRNVNAVTALNYADLYVNPSQPNANVLPIPTGHHSLIRYSRDDVAALASCSIDSVPLQVAQPTNPSSQWTTTITVIGMQTALYYTVIYDVH